MSRPVPADARAIPRTDLAALFAPRGIAVVGASRSPGKLGASLARSLRGFENRGGYLALVNSRDSSMYDSIYAAATAGPVDLAMICVPAAACPQVLAEAAEAGARAAVICGGGFAEAGGIGITLQRELVAVVADTGIRLLGPNTSGFLAPPAGLSASFVPGVTTVRAGHVAVVAASGGVNHALAFLFAEAGHGLSLAVGLGNAVDITAPDVLDYLAADPDTAAIALHVESVVDGRRLLHAVQSLISRTPVVALVVGRNDIGAFAASHTGALATSWRTTRAALAQAGAVLVDDERELVDAVGALAIGRAAASPNPGAGIVTAQAGPGLLLLDDLRGRRANIPELSAATQRVLATLLPPLTFQRNPVDTGRPGPELGQVMVTVASDPSIDVIAGYALHEPDAVDLVAAMQEGRIAGVPVVLGVGGTGMDVVEVRRTLLAAGIAVSTDPHGVAAASGALLADARARHRAMLADGDSYPVDVLIDIRIDDGPYDENDAKDLLTRLGIGTTRRRVCGDRDSAHVALTALGGSVAVKVLDASVLHKTEIGGVHLGVRTDADLDTALDALEATGARRFLVEAMASAGVDLVVSTRRDPVFGPIVLLGLGGTTAEALTDVSVRLAPLSLEEAATMPSELTGRALLDGWRGGPKIDLDELSRIIATLGSVIATYPDIDEIEINPLRLTAAGLVALDAVVITREVCDADSD
jgi:acyl-CoA synthetase (NDP forming)